MADPFTKAVRARRPRWAALLCCAALCASCGARTGLKLPDASVPDDVVEVPCIEIPLDGSGAVVDLATDAELKRADVFLLLDSSSSMEDEHEEIRSRLRNNIAPLVFETIEDTEFGVGAFSDFPIGQYGAAGDRPFELLLTMTDDLLDVQGALRNLGLQNGVDKHESQIEALYQVATGDGLGSHIGPSLGCPRGGFGAPCFRDDAQPVVLLFTDAPMHNGPGEGTECDFGYGDGCDYIGISPPPHTYREARDALRENRIHVIGLWSNPSSKDRGDLDAVVLDSGAIGVDGQPLVFDIGENGERLGSSVVSALQEFAQAAIFDVGVVANDPTPNDGVDVRDFVASIRPVRAQPMGDIEGIDEELGLFLGVKAGTTIIYEVTIRGDAIVPAGEPRVFRLELIFRGDGVTFLGSRQVDLVIPSITGEGCPPAGEGSQ